jgi:hypothetical protein
MERKWKKSHSEEDWEAFCAQKVQVCQLITVAKTEYFSNKLSDASVKEMYATINGLLNKPTKILPVCDSNKELADKFLNIFTEKVEKIRANVGSVDACHTEPAVPCIPFCEFRSLTSDEIEKIIRRFPNKSCLLDTFPSWLVKDNLHILLPVISQIVNASLTAGIFPDLLKQSVVTPIFKKSTMDPEILKSYRPVANIKFLSKIIEKAASCQTTDHVDGNHLSEVFQSAYKRQNSTETALLKVQSDILQSLDNNKAVFMVLLDMSAAFDTVDHDILSKRLKHRFGMGGAVQSWYNSYLKNRTTRVTIGHEFSAEHVLKYSLPQGSIIGPQGFTMYITPVGDVIRGHGISFHAYADDIQLYEEFDPKSDVDRQRVLEKLSSCISEVSSWMSNNCLQLNQDKTEFFIFANCRVLPSLSNVRLKIDNIFIHPSASVKNLGVTFDGSLNMSLHVNSLCKTVNFHIRNLWRIRRFITKEACHHAVRGLVLSRLDYANSLLLSARQSDLKRLQRLQNKAARLVFACGRDQSSADLFVSLHWLPVKDRLSYKIALFIFKCIINEAPSYLRDLVRLHSSLVPEENRRRLRSSSDRTRLVVPRSKRKAGDHSFQLLLQRLRFGTSCLLI